VKSLDLTSRPMPRCPTRMTVAGAKDLCNLSGRVGYPHGHQHNPYTSDTESKDLSY
jgi:hypothetical protein